MTFLWPYLLLLLALLIPGSLWLYGRYQRRRQRLAELYGSLGQVRGPGGRQPRQRQHLPFVLFLGGLIALVFALARPQATLITPRLEGTVILAFDVSGSMNADDLDPNRLEAAKQAAYTFVERLPATVRVGVVAFSDSGFSVQPPTHDQEAILGSIQRLRPQRGTALAQGIFASLQASGHSAGDLGGEPPSESLADTGAPGSTVIVLLSDGENNMDPPPHEAAEAAAESGVRIYTVGIGSPMGATLNIDGFLIHSQLDEVSLQQVALITGGQYYNAQDRETLQGIYENLAPQLALRPETIEVTALFTAVGILLLLAGGMLTLFWFSRLP